MEKTQTPIKMESTNDRRVHSLFEIGEETEPREEAFHKADDDGDELPFDVPRD